MKYKRYFPGGLNHGDFDGPHNDAATMVIECEPCLQYVKSMMANLDTLRDIERKS